MPIGFSLENIHDSYLAGGMTAKDPWESVRRSRIGHAAGSERRRRERVREAGAGGFIGGPPPGSREVGGFFGLGQHDVGPSASEQAAYEKGQVQRLETMFALESQERASKAGRRAEVRDVGLIARNFPNAMETLLAQYPEHAEVIRLQHERGIAETQNRLEMLNLNMQQTRMKYDEARERRDWMQSRHAIGMPYGQELHTGLKKLEETHAGLGISARNKEAIIEAMINPAGGKLSNEDREKLRLDLIKEQDNYTALSHEVAIKRGWFLKGQEPSLKDWSGYLGAQDPDSLRVWKDDADRASTGFWEATKETLAGTGGLWDKANPPEDIIQGMQGIPEMQRDSATGMLSPSGLFRPLSESTPVPDLSPVQEPTQAPVQEQLQEPVSTLDEQLSQGPRETSEELRETTDMLTQLIGRADPEEEQIELYENNLALLLGQPRV